MSLLECIKKAADANLINNAKQTELELDYKAIKESFIKKGFTEQQADKMAGRDTFDNLRYRASIKAKQALLTSKLQEEFIQQMRTFKNAKGEIDYGSVIKQKFNWTENAEGVKRIASVEEEVPIVKALLFSEMEKTLVTFRHNLLGQNRNKATLLTMGREIFNLGSTGNKAAEEMAVGWNAAHELGRKLFNDAGGSIPKKKNGVYGLPTRHNSSTIREAEYDGWKKFLLEDNKLLDLENMIDHKTGKPFTEEQLELTLRDVYETIKSEGYNKNSNHNFSSNIGNRRMDHRFLEFKDFDSWLIYHKRFGTTSNAFDVMINHLTAMAKDIALMRVLSPNPKNFLNWMKQTAKKELKTSNIKDPKLFDRLEKKLESDIYTAESSLSYHSGDSFDPVTVWMARGFAGLRQLTTGMYLGSAFVLSINDFLTTALTSKTNGLPALKSMNRSLKMFVKEGLNKDKSTMIKVALTSGMIADHFPNVASGISRISLEEMDSPEITRRVADFVLRSSGLSWFTQAGRWGVGMEFMAYLAREVGNSFEDLKIKDPDFFNLLNIHNITKSDWDIIRSTKLYDAGIDDPKYKGALFLKPIDILKRTDYPERVLSDVQAKIQRSMNYVIDFSIPNAKAAGAIAIKQQTKPGTIPGEIANNFLQFKSFPFAIHLTHITKGWGKKTLGGKLGYLIPFIVGTSAVGALTYELKQITKGKDITNFDKMNKGDVGKYTLNAVLHGGGFGLIGDILFSGRYGTASSVAALAGSVPLFLAQIIEMTFGVASKKLEGKDPNVGGQISEFIKKNTPGGSIWYARLALERWLFDNLSEWIDPKYAEKRKRLNKKVNREQKTKFWWKPGRKFPSRPPEF
jgi:hypothetical protein